MKLPPLMKLAPLALLVMMVISKAATYGIRYYIGYYENSYEPLDYEFMLMMLDLLLPVALCILLVVSLCRRKHRVWTAGMVAGALVLAGLGRVLPPSGQMVLYGLRDRLRRDVPPGTLRQFTQDIHQLRPLPGDSEEEEAGAKKISRNHLIKAGLWDKYPFLTWVKHDGIDGPGTVFERDGTVRVDWGGVLQGYWGFMVKVDGGKLEEPRPYWDSVRFSDDILVTLE